MGYINGNSRVLEWRYLPYIRPIFEGYVRGYTPKLWPRIWYERTSILGSWNSHWFGGFNRGTPGKSSILVGFSMKELPSSYGATLSSGNPHFTSSTPLQLVCMCWLNPHFFPLNPHRISEDPHVNQHANHRASCSVGNQPISHPHAWQSFWISLFGVFENSPNWAVFKSPVAWWS